MKNFEQIPGSKFKQKYKCDQVLEWIMLIFTLKSIHITLLSWGFSIISILWKIPYAYDKDYNLKNSIVGLELLGYNTNNVDIKMGFFSQ